MEAAGRGKRQRSELPEMATPATDLRSPAGIPVSPSSPFHQASFTDVVHRPQACPPFVCQNVPLISISDDDVQIGREARGPTIRFSKTVKDQLITPWQNAIIVKLLGVKHTFKYFEMKLRQKWAMLTGHWSVLDIADDYYIVRFDSPADRQYVLTEGPWIITGHYLVMQNWEPGFNTSASTVSKMTVWLRVSALHVEWFNIPVLTKIGNILGTLHKVDMRAVTYSRGQYARICVELDLTKSLEREIKVDDIWYTIQYEALHLVCFKCGIFGHDSEHCPSLVTTDPSVEMTQPNSNATAGSSSTTAVPELTGTCAFSVKNLVQPTLAFSRRLPTGTVPSHTSTTTANVDSPSQWQTPKPRRQRRTANTNQQQQRPIASAAHGSRYEVLTHAEDTLDTSPTTVTTFASQPPPARAHHISLSSANSKKTTPKKGSGYKNLPPAGRTTATTSISTRPRVQPTGSSAMQFSSSTKPISETVFVSATGTSTAQLSSGTPMEVLTSKPPPPPDKSTSDVVSMATEVNNVGEAGTPTLNSELLQDSVVPQSAGASPTSHHDHQAFIAPPSRPRIQTNAPSAMHFTFPDATTTAAVSHADSFPIPKVFAFNVATTLPDDAVVASRPSTSCS